MVQLDPAPGGRVEPLGGALGESHRGGCAAAARQRQHDADLRVVDRRVVAQRGLDLGRRAAGLKGSRRDTAQRDGDPGVRRHGVILFGGRHGRARGVNLAAAGLRRLADGGCGLARFICTRRACGDRDRCRDGRRGDQCELLTLLVERGFGHVSSFSSEVWALLCEQTRELGSGYFDCE